MTKETIRSTGALPDPLDARDITLGMLQTVAIAPTSLPDSHKTDISMFPVLDQGKHSACVGYARALCLSYFLHKETGVSKLVSPRFIYALAKQFDGIPNIQGTYPRIAALKNMDIGALLEEDMASDTKLAIKEFMSLTLTDEMKIKAAFQRIQSFATVAKTEADLCRAIVENGLVEVSLSCDGVWSKLPIKNKSVLGLHRVVIYGYERKEDDTRFYFRNSWGKWGENGNGYFDWKDFYDAGIFDMYVFVDIPKEKLEEVRKIPLVLSYTWGKTLHAGVKGEDVKMLQYALKLEGCMDVLEPADGFFGFKTKASVEKYQNKHDITPDGVVGAQTRAILNASYKPKDLLSRWALAIQNHEGYFAPGQGGHQFGSRSWRNKNPGNIKYMGMFKKLAVGEDKGHFCIFKTYEEGFEALKTLLRNAATGKSTSYNPDMPLWSGNEKKPGFFDKYAPKTDGNNPYIYAVEVAKFLGVSVDTPIKSLI